MTRIALLALLMIGQAAQTPAPTIPVAQTPVTVTRTSHLAATSGILKPEPGPIWTIDPLLGTFSSSLVFTNGPRDLGVSFSSPVQKDNGDTVYTVTATKGWNCQITATVLVAPTIAQLTCVKADADKE